MHVSVHLDEFACYRMYVSWHTQNHVKGGRRKKGTINIVTLNFLSADRKW